MPEKAEDKLFGSKKNIVKIFMMLFAYHSNYSLS